MPSAMIAFDLRHPRQFGTSGRAVYAAALGMASWAGGRGFSPSGPGPDAALPRGSEPAGDRARGATRRRLRVATDPGGVGAVPERVHRAGPFRSRTGAAPRSCVLVGDQARQGGSVGTA